MGTQAATGSSTKAVTQQAAREAISGALDRLPSGKPDMCLLFVSPKLDFKDTLQVARGLLPDTPVAACTTAGEITERGLTHGGVAAMLIRSDDARFDTRCAKNVTADTHAAVDVLADAFSEKRQEATADGLLSSLSLMLVDGINGRGEALIDELVRKTGGLHEVVGGAAGDEGEFSGTRVGSGQEASFDAAVCVQVFSKHRWGVGVDHGLSPISPMMRVTKAEGVTVHELDGRPAFEAYRDFAQSKGMDLKPGEAGLFFINNELGVHLFDRFQNARAPLAVEGQGSLRCAATVPQGSSVCILGGDRTSLVKAAGKAAEEAHARLNGRKAAAVLLFDCICRGTILGEDFDRELAAVQAVFPDTPVAGFLTYGEIARYGGRLAGWHNTTAVVVAIPA